MRKIISFFFTLTVFGMLFLMMESGNENPRILLFAFCLSYILKIMTIEFFTRIHEGKIFPVARLFLFRMTGRPASGTKSFPLTSADTGKPQKFPVYLLLMGSFLFTVILLVHVNKHHKLDFQWMVFLKEMFLSFLVSLLYLGGDLCSRTIIMDFDADRETNLGYNARELRILAFALFPGAMAIAFFQATGRDLTPWIVYIPLVLIRQISDWRLLDHSR